jgi:hypothetical protein
VVIIAPLVKEGAMDFGKEAAAFRAEWRAAARREVAFRILEGLETIEITRGVLARAAQPLPTPVGTLDAIHLVSAMGWLEQFESPAFATHDLALAAAARASGFEIIGASQG